MNTEQTKAKFSRGMPKSTSEATLLQTCQLQGVFYLLQIAVYPPLDHHGSDVSHAQINIRQNHNAGEIRGAGNAFVYTEVLTLPKVGRPCWTIS